jgi:oligoendopeptidase F
VAGQLIERAKDPDQRRALAATRADTLVATVFRQSALSQFERSAYARRAAGEVLLADRLGELWTGSMRQLYGSAVEGYPQHRADWALVPHFVRTRFYNYSYVLAALGSLVLSGRHRRGEAASAYRALLQAGGSASTGELLALVGLDHADPHCWSAGLAELAELISAVGQPPVHSVAARSE